MKQFVFKQDIGFEKHLGIETERISIIEPPVKSFHNMVKKATVGSDNATTMAANRNMNSNTSSSGNIFNNDYGDKIIRELSETI